MGLLAGLKIGRDRWARRAYRGVSHPDGVPSGNALPFSTPSHAEIASKLAPTPTTFGRERRPLDKLNLHPTNQQLTLVHHFLRQVRMQIEEQFLVSQHFGAP